MSEQVFANFYRKHYNLLLATAQQRLRPEEDPEDAVSQAFEIAWRHYQRSGELEIAWTYQTLRNIIGDRYRRRQRTQVLLEQSLALITADTPNQFSPDVHDLQQSILKLSSSDQDLLRMRFWEDLSGREMAAILGCSETAIRTRMMRAKRNLADLLTKSETRPTKRGHRS